jgi:hypothetical protein
MSQFIDAVGNLFQLSADGRIADLASEIARHLREVE